jgi:nicotinamidase-related amidase
VQQLIFIKTHRDPFTNPKLDRLLTEMPAERFVLFGAGLECSLRLLALGLLLRGRRVAVAHDACGYWHTEEADMTLRQLAAKGCEIIATRQLIEQSLSTLRPVTFIRRRSVA